MKTNGAREERKTAITVGGLCVTATAAGAAAVALAVWLIARGFNPSVTKKEEHDVR